MEATKSTELNLIENDTTKSTPATTTATAAEKRKKPSVKRKIKRKKIREEGEPKMPLTGYVRFMNERRDKLRIEYPSKSAIDHTKIIGEEWNTMSESAKAPYLTAYLEERAKYNKELCEFMQSKRLSENGQENHNRSLLRDIKQVSTSTSTTTATANANANANVTANNDGKKILEKTQMNGTRGDNTSAIGLNKDLPLNMLKNNQPPPPLSRCHPGENGIPIFTDEFLDHNKTVDLELRTLRKSNIDYEQQNSALEKHIENMKFGVEKIENENLELEEKNVLLQTYLDKLKIKLAQALSGLSIPSEPQGATLDNIEKYMHDLYGMVASNSHGPASLNKAKDIIRKLDLHIQL